MIRERILNTNEIPAVEDVEFIELSVCPEYNTAYNETIFENYGTNKENYRKKGQYFNKQGKESYDLRAIFDSVTYDINEILRKVEINTGNKGKKFLIDFSGKNFSENVDITTNYWPNFGRCYSLHIKDHVIESHVRSITLYARMSVHIYIGFPGQFMHPNHKSKVCYGNYVTVNIYPLYLIVNIENTF